MDEKDIIIPYDESKTKWYDAGCSDMDNYYCMCPACASAQKHAKHLIRYKPVKVKMYEKRIANKNFQSIEKLIREKRLAKSKNMIK